MREFMSNELLYHFFDDDDFLLISTKIKEMEKLTAGEIRVAIKEEKSFKNRKKAIRDLAEEEFIKLGMNGTRDRTGILIYIHLELRQFYILADEGINSKVEQVTWDNIRDEMQAEFKSGHYTEGIVNAIGKVGKILGEHFPIKTDDTNELSNKVVL
jgi:uncharacterized membrane protein